jgi:thiamine biosynthesis lipoprotein
LYDARDGRIGARHEQVTVLASRDCLEADALATTLSVLPLAQGQRLIERWPGAEALWLEPEGVYASTGLGDHVWKA